MQQKKSGLMDKASDFVAGKGFYIILALCAAAIGVSGYVLFFTGNDVSEDEPLPISNVAPALPEADTPVALPEENVPAPATNEDEIVEKTTEAPKEQPQEKAQEGKKANAPAQVPVAAAPVADSFILPVTGGQVLRGFSGDQLVKDETMGDWRVHSGVDITCADGNKVCSIGDGKVTKIFHDEMTGYCVTIDHGNGVVSTVRGLMKNATVKEGEAVKKGTVIGGGGSTNVTESKLEPHIHLEVTKDGALIDPLTLIEVKQ